MDTYTENCMICGEQLIYFESAQKLNCYICGKEFDSNNTCEDGHFVCDACHSEQGLLSIAKQALSNDSKNPIEIAIEMMQDSSINMHGPEHHYLVSASLLVAYKNAGGDIDFENSLQKTLERAKNVPGGICGMWGSCGAGIASGIFISVITGATPVSEKEWSLANEMTSKSLDIISKNGGPRCCKRNSFLAISKATAFVKDIFDITLEMPEKVICDFYPRNIQCRKADCLYYPTVKK